MMWLFLLVLFAGSTLIRVGRYGALHCLLHATDALPTGGGGNCPQACWQLWHSDLPDRFSAPSVGAVAL